MFRKIGVLIMIFFCLNSLVSQEFKVIGFLPHYRFHLINDIDFSSVTHINLAFANPDMEGNLTFENADIEPVVSMLHEQGKEVFISLAGGYLIPEWDLAWIHLQKEENRSDFIYKIMNYCQQYEIDGIDMDIEWQYVGSNYSGFVLELADSCAVNNLTLTASLPGTYRYPEITNETLDAFKWINMMVYDLKGPWNPTDIGQHSPYYFALNSIYYWNEQGIPNSRLSLGVPFYGYDFTDTNNVFARTYGNIIELNENNAYYEQFGDIYYNGILLIKAKAQLALDDNLLGIMIWELGQDHFSQLSLLKAIDEVINPIISQNEITTEVKLYPNPTSDILYIEDIAVEELNLYDMMGNPVVIANSHDNALDLSLLESAVYILRIRTKEGMLIQKLITKI